MSQALGRFTFTLRLTVAGQFIADLQKERRLGNVSSEIEQHLKREFRRLGWEAPDATLAAAIESMQNPGGAQGQADLVQPVRVRSG
jgi:hypothetical protein